MKKRYKFLLIFLAFLCITGVAGFLLQGYLNDQIRDLFIRELNKQLTAEIQVKEVKLSIFRDFPYASVRITGVIMKEAVKKPSKGVLMRAELVSLRFSLFDLLGDKFTVTNVLVSDAAFHMKVFSDGSDNYHFWKSGTGSSSKDFNIDLQKISVRNTQVSYSDISAGQDMRWMIHSGDMKGKFSSTDYQMDVAAKVRIENLTQANTNYLKDREAGINLSLHVNEPKGLYTIKEGDLQFSELGLTVNGNIIYRSDRRDLDLQLSTREASLSEMVSVVPATYRKQLDEYTFEGDGALEVNIGGSFMGSDIPSVNARLKVDKGEIGRKGSGASLEDVSLTATYQLAQNQTKEQLTITGLTAKLKNGFISGNLSMSGFSSSQIKAALKADVDLEDARELLALDTITSLDGRLLLDGYFDGRLANLNKPALTDLPQCKLSGKVQVTKAQLALKGYALPMKSIEGDMAFDNNFLQLKNLSFLMGKSDFKAKGTVNNLMAWLLIKGQKLSFQGDISSGRTNWDELSESSSGSGEYHFSLPSDIEIQSLKLNIKNFSFRKFEAASFSSDVKLKNKVLTVNNIRMQSMKGVVTGQGSVNAGSPDHILLQCKATFSKVNLKSLFSEFGNFGNTDLTYDNLDGAITADVVYASVMYPNLDMDLQSVKAHADIRVENGRLVNYEPMKGLSKFLRVEDLADIRFETLQNQIDIANRIIYIPVMKIKSSAIDLSLMGTHTFDNEIDYHFSLALADLMAAKFNKRNPGYNKQSEFGPIEDDNRGRTMVYVSMTGTVDDPEFAYDKKAVRDKLSSELKNQKNELKEVFRKEFGGSSSDTIRKSQQMKEKAIQKKQEEGKFVIEWDDDKK